MSTVAELVQKMRAAAEEWHEASKMWHGAAAGDGGGLPRAGLRLSKAQTGWYVLCSTENVLRLCDALALTADIESPT